MKKGTSTNIISPKYLKAEHQTAARAGPANKANNFADFDKVDAEQYFDKIDGLGYLEAAIDVAYAKNDYFNQNSNLK